MMKHTLQSVAVFLFFATILLAGAVPAYAVVYQPGATLDPNCFPTDPTCYVEPPLVLSAATSSTIAIASSFTATSTSASTLPYASTTAISVSGGNATTSALTLGVVNGVLRAVSGVVQATLVNLASDVTGVLGIGNGGTGISTAPSYGQLLVGNASGGYTLVSTSSLGIASGATPVGTSGQIQFNNYGVLGSSAGLTFATSSGTLSATAGSFGSMMVSSTSTTSGLSAQFASVASGVVNTISSAFASITNATVGSLTATSSLAVLGSTSLQNASTTQLSVSGPSWYAGPATFGNASTTLLSVSGPAYFNSTTTFNGVGLSFPGTAGSSGQVLMTNGAGGLSWATVTGGGGYFATSSDSLSIHPSNSSYVLVLGGTATSTSGNILEVIGSSLYRGALTAYNTVTAPNFVATSTTVASSFQNASTTQFTVSGPSWFSGLANLASAAVATLTGYNATFGSLTATSSATLATTTATGLTISNNGLTIASSSPLAAANTLYNISGTLYWSGNALGLANVNNGTVLGDMPMWDGTKWSRSGGLSYATSTSLFSVSGTASSTNLVATNASTTQLTISGPSWHTGLATFASASSTQLSVSGLSWLATTTATGLTISNNGLTIASSTPAATLSSLYNLGGTLYWNGSAIKTGAENFAFAQNYGATALTGSSTMPWWSQGALYASSTLAVAGQTSLQNASTTQLSVSGPSWFSGIANLASAVVATLTSGNATISSLTATSSLSVAGMSALATTTIAGTNSFTMGSGLATFGGNVTINGLLGIVATTTMGNVLDMSSNRILNVATPTGTNDAANKSYVDAMAQGMTWQSPVIAIATSTTPLSAVAGNRYIINDATPATATSCAIGKIAQYNGSSWSCLTPALGWTAYVTQESISYNWNGTLWVSLGSTVNHDNLADLQGGQSGQYYHLNQADYNNVHNINAQLAQLLTIGSPSFQSLTLTGTTSGASMNVTGLSSLQNATATQFTVSGPSWFSGLANLASAAVATLTGYNATFGSLTATSSATLATTTATGLALSNNGLTIASSSPLAAANTLYNISGTLYWSGNALGLANVNNGTVLGDMPMWDGTKWSRSGGLSYATSTSLFNVNGTASSTNLVATNASTSLLTVNGPSWFSGFANLASAAVATFTGYNTTVGSLTATSSLSVTGTTVLATTTISGPATLANASTTQLSVSGLSWLATTTATGLTISNNGLTIASSTPAATLSSLYNLGGTLYWNGSAIKTGAENFAFAQNYGATALTGSSTMPWWSQGALYASSTLAVAGQTSLQNASTTQLSVSGPSWFNGLATFASASSTQLSVSGLSWLATTTATGLAISNNGLTIASSTPAATLNSLYNLGGTLYWSGNALGLANVNNGTTLGDMPIWDGTKWSRSGGLSYATSTSLFSVSGTASSTNLVATNASTTQLSVSGPSWFNGLVTISNSTANTTNAVSINTNALTTGSALSITSSYASGNSTNGLLYVANTGAVTSGIIGRIQSNSTAGSGLTVWANGGVGINTSAPTSNALSVVGNIDLGNNPGKVNFNGAFLAYGGSGQNSYGMDLGYNSTSGRYSTRLFTPTSADIVFANIPTSTLPPSQASTTPMMTIRGDTGYVGIGTSAPYTALHVVGQALLSGSANRLMLAKNDGSDPAASTVWMLDNDVPSGLFRIFTEPTYGSTGVVRFALNTSSGYMNVTLGSAISSTGVCYGSGSAGLSLLGTCSSDARLKTNVQDLAATSGLAAIMRLRPVSFDWRDATSSLQGTQMGFIAQELDPVLPGVIGVGGTTTITLADGTTQTITDTRSINYNALWAPTILAIQQLAAQNASTTLALTGTTTPGLAYVSTTTAEQSFESSWFAGILRSFFASVTNGIDTAIARVFKAQEVDTQQLCVTDSSGAKTCITKGQLDALLSGKAQTASAAGSSGGGSSSTPAAVTLSINGNNPATIFVGDSYQDLGAAITSPASAQNLGIKAIIDGRAPIDMSSVTIDTSVAGDHTIDYVVVDQTGATTTAERIVHVVAHSGSNQTATTSLPKTDTQSADPALQDSTSTHNQSTPGSGAASSTDSD